MALCSAPPPSLSLDVWNPLVVCLFELRKRKKSLLAWPKTPTHLCLVALELYFLIVFKHSHVKSCEAFQQEIFLYSQHAFKVVRVRAPRECAQTRNREFFFTFSALQMTDFLHKISPLSVMHLLAQVGEAESGRADLPGGHRGRRALPHAATGCSNTTCNSCSSWEKNQSP